VHAAQAFGLLLICRAEALPHMSGSVTTSEHSVYLAGGLVLGASIAV
jgi:hypothetical protein